MSPAVAQRWPERTPLERLLEKVEARPDGCIVWTAYVDPRGYGRLNVDGRVLLAHRLAYEAFVGPIPEGLTLDHLCRNRACVNPEHLEPVTLDENKRRGESLPAQNARKTHCPRGHAYDEANTRVNRVGHRACRACRREDAQARSAEIVAARAVRRCQAPGCDAVLPQHARLDRRACSERCKTRIRRAKVAVA